MFHSISLSALKIRKASAKTNDRRVYVRERRNILYFAPMKRQIRWSPAAFREQKATDYGLVINVVLRSGMVFQGRLHAQTDAQRIALQVRDKVRHWDWAAVEEIVETNASDF